MAITPKLLAWYDQNRRSFPFRGTRDPYCVWLSEIMLQQTRTETAGPYYERFVLQFPDVFALAQTPVEQVLKAWEGLGYYSRAHNLHKAAQMIVNEYGGVFPNSAAGLRALPGVGPYAAAAIASIAYDEPVPAMDGNLNRVISRLYCVEHDIDTPETKKKLYALAIVLMPPVRAGVMNQALMDLGAMICLPGTPDCEKCPLNGECRARLDGDPARLPVMKTKKPPVIIPVGVGIVCCERRVLLFQREQALLRGLYVFLLSEGDSGPEAMTKAANKLLSASLTREMGEARHIFTHRVWGMRLYHLEAQACDPVPGGVWADAEGIMNLAIPTAMRAAKNAALHILNNRV